MNFLIIRSHTFLQKIYLLSGEDIDGNQVNLSVTVLTSLGGRHINNLTGSALDDNVAVLSQGGTLHGEGKRSSGISGFKGVFFVSHAVSKVNLQNIQKKSSLLLTLIIKCKRKKRKKKEKIDIKRV
jgi:hypothetical protein